MSDGGGVRADAIATTRRALHAYTAERARLRGAVARLEAEVEQLRFALAVERDRTRARVEAERARPVPGEGRVRGSVSLPARHWAWLEATGRGNRSAAVRALIEAALRERAEGEEAAG